MNYLAKNTPSNLHNTDFMPLPLTIDDMLSLMDLKTLTNSIRDRPKHFVSNWKRLTFYHQLEAFNYEVRSISFLIAAHMVPFIFSKLWDFLPVSSFMYKSLRTSIITDRISGSFHQYFMGTIDPENGRSTATEKLAPSKKLTKAVLISIGVWYASVPIQISALSGFWSNSYGSGYFGKLWQSKINTCPFFLYNSETAFSNFSWCFS